MCFPKIKTNTSKQRRFCSVSVTVKVLKLSVVTHVGKQKYKWKLFDTESLESGKWKKKNMKNVLPRIRSMQWFICEIFGKRFTQNYKALYEDAMFCPFQGHKYGRRKPTESRITLIYYVNYENMLFLNFCLLTVRSSRFFVNSIQVRRIFRIRDIRRNVLHKFIEICMETPCWCPPGWAPTWRTETSRNICYRVLLQKREFILRETHKH